MMDFAQLGMSGADMLKVFDMLGEYAPKIRELTEKIDTVFLPMAKEYEKKYDCQEGEYIFYSTAISDNNAFIYISKVTRNENGNIEHKEIMERYELKALIEKLLQYLPQ